MSDIIESAAPAAAPEAVSTPAEVTQETGAEVDAAPDAPAAEQVAAEKAAIKAEIKKWKLKVDGKEEEFDEETLLKHASMGKAAQKRMQESSELKKNVEAFIKALQTDPLKVISDPGLGINAEVRKALAQAIMNGEIEEMQKSPEQKELEAARRELEEIKSNQKKTEEERNRLEFERLQEQAAKTLDTDITSALEGSGLPKSPYTVKKLAEVMMIALQNNIDITAKEAIPLIKKQMQAEIKEMFTATPEDLIEEFLGKDNVSRLRKRNLAKIKAGASLPSSSSDVKPSGAAKDEAAPKKMSMRDFMKGSLV